MNSWYFPFHSTTVVRAIKRNIDNMKEEPSGIYCGHQNVIHIYYCPGPTFKSYYVECKLCEIVLLCTHHLDLWAMGVEGGSRNIFLTLALPFHFFCRSPLPHLTYFSQTLSCVIVYLTSMPLSEFSPPESWVHHGGPLLLIQALEVHIPRKQEVSAVKESRLFHSRTRSIRAIFADTYQRPWGKLGQQTIVTLFDRHTWGKQLIIQRL